MTPVAEVVDNLGEEEAASKETTVLALVTFSVGQKKKEKRYP